MIMMIIIIIIDRFYLALFSALEQTVCVHVTCDSESSSCNVVYVHRDHKDYYPGDGKGAQDGHLDTSRIPTSSCALMCVFVFFFF